MNLDDLAKQLDTLKADAIKVRDEIGKRLDQQSEEFKKFAKDRLYEFKSAAKEKLLDIVIDLIREGPKK